MIKVDRGSVLTEALHYKLAASQTIAKGDLVRINTSGLIQLASATSAHGIALKNGASVAVPATETIGDGDLFPVAMFNVNTVVEITMPDASVATDLVKGVTYTVDPTTQAVTITETTTNGILTVVGYPTDDSIDPDVSDTLTGANGGTVYGSFTQAALDARAAAA